MHRKIAGAIFVATVAFGNARPASAAPPLYTLPPRYDHVVIAILENVNPEQVVGSLAAPYITSLANDGASFDRLYAFKHTSAPNYGELFAGHENGINDSSIPPGVPFTTPNLGAALRHAGLSFTGYSQSLPAPGSTVFFSGKYTRGHNPWVNWQNDATDAHPNQLPSSTNLPFDGYFPADFTQLPTVAIVVPDNAHNMHDGPTPQRITVGDNWIRDNLGAYAAWARNNNSLLIITADEDARNLNNNLNKIPTVFYGAHVKDGVAIPQSYTLHDILRTVEDMYGLPHAQAANYVRPIVGPFIGDPTLTRRILTNSRDTHLRRDQPSTSFANSTTLRVDLDDSDSSGDQPVHALVRFDNIVGDAANQIPADATVLSAKLTLWTSASGATATPVSLHRMLTNCDESSTWNSLSSGITPNGVEAQVAEDFLFAPAVNSHPFFFDVSDTVQAWLDGAPNHGWAIVPTGTDTWEFISSENSTTAQRPALELTYALYPRWAPTAGASWDDPSNWKYGLPNAPAAVARFGPVEAPSAIEFATPKTLGTLLIDSGTPYTFTGLDGAQLFLANRGNTAAIYIKQGRHTLSAPIQLSDSTVIETAQSAALTLTHGITLAAGKTLTKSGPGALEVSATISLGPDSTLDIAQGHLAVDQIQGSGRLSIQPNAKVQLTGDAQVPTHLSSLDLLGQLDIGNAPLTIDQSPLPAILNHLRESRITSSGMAADPSLAIAYTTDPTSVTLRIALAGDANLDGAVTFEDLVALAQHYQLDDADISWSTGDFDHDGDVGFSDLTLLAQNYSPSVPQNIPSASRFFPSQIPEPAAALGLFLTALLSPLKRPRRVK